MRLSIALLRTVVFGVTTIACVWGNNPARSSDESIQRPIENVFLSDWHLLGPFAENETDEVIEASNLFSDGGVIDISKGVTHSAAELNWSPFPERVVDFLSGLDVSGDVTDERTAFAVTRFQVDDARPAVLSLSYDDYASAWLNGERVHHDPNSRTGATIDQAMVPVELKAGVNTLLLQVGQYGRNWEAAARLLPAGVQEPLLAVTFNNGTPGDMTRLPVVNLTLLAGDGTTIREMQTSGLRNSRFLFTRYTAYGDPLSDSPRSVRISWSGRGIRPARQTFAWNDVQNETFKLRLLSDKFFRMLVTDENTGAPIKGAQLWKGTVRIKNTTAKDGRVSVSHLSPLAKDVHVVAEGYQAKKVMLPWPFGNEVKVGLQPGGLTVRGKVVSTDGLPIAGARIAPGLYSGYMPKATTDKKGEFAIHGIPADNSTLFPVIQANGFVAKDTFRFDLQSTGTTEVTWELASGTVVFGRVVDRATGKGIEGVTVESGRDRFGSNQNNPSTKSMLSGVFRLTGIPEGSVLVHAFSDNHRPKMETVVTSVTKPTEVVFELEPGKPVTGTVTNPKGEPLVSVWLVTDTWDSVRMFRRETRTNDKGEFTLEHMPDSASEVHVLLRDYVSKRDLSVVGGDHVEVTLEPIVEHTVRIFANANKEPVPDLQIQIGYLWAGRDEVSWQSPGYETDRYYDKANGVFKIQNGETAAGAEISYRFRAIGFEDVVLKTPNAREGSQSIDIAMKPVGLIE